MDKYYLPDNYICNPPGYDSQLSHTDGYQNDVYAAAKELAIEHRYETIYDIGTGSGFKLMKFFYDYATIGTDVKRTVTGLKEKYPDRIWRVSDFSTIPVEPIDLIICADVIEHLEDPDELFNHIAHINYEYIVISTPDRNTLVAKGIGKHTGPPGNKTHVREWGWTQFAMYVSSHIDYCTHYAGEKFGQYIVGSQHE